MSLFLTHFSFQLAKEMFNMTHRGKKRLNNFHQNPITEPCLILFFLSSETSLYVCTRGRITLSTQFSNICKSLFHFPIRERKKKKHLKPRNDKQWITVILFLDIYMYCCWLLSINTDRYVDTHVVTGCVTMGLYKEIFTKAQLKTFFFSTLFFFAVACCFLNL